MIIVLTAVLAVIGGLITTVLLMDLGRAIAGRKADFWERKKK